MHFMKLCVFAMVGLFLVGCAAPQPPVPLSGDFHKNSGAKVGLVLSMPEGPDFSTEGDVRLLDYAIISAAMAGFNKHVKTLDLSEFKAIEKGMSNILQAGGFEAQILSEYPDVEALGKFKDPDEKDTEYYASKDMTPLAEDLGIDYLLTLEVWRIGFARPYTSFIPMAPPRAVFNARGQLIDLHNNRLLWYAGIYKANDTDGDWDEPPSFPGLTNSYYVTLEEAKQEILDIFSPQKAAAKEGENITAQVDM